MARFIDLALSAVLLAGLYATMAYGLGLIYGVLRVVNLNHGGMIMLGAYAGWWAKDTLGLDPYLALPMVLAAAFLTGRSNPDFASEDYEFDFEGRARPNDLSPLGQMQMGLRPWP